VIRPPVGGTLSSLSRHLLLALLAAAVLTVSACSRDSVGEDEAATTTSTTAPPETTTTTTTLPGGRQPTAEDPLRVILGGDSVMAGLAPAVSHALNEGGSARSQFVLTPSVARDSATTALWQLQLERTDPELVVMLIGTWERLLAGPQDGQVQTTERYVTETLQPFVDLVTSQGAKLLWIGMPAVREPDPTLIFARLNEAFLQLAERNPGSVYYLSGSEFVAGSGFTELITNPDGSVERLRAVDGHHLCQDGAVRLSRPVLDWVVSQWNVPLAPNWQDGPWRDPATYYGSQACPAV